MPDGERNKLYYPHLLPEETRVWRKFLGIHEERFDRFDYDVHISEGTRPDAPPGDRYADNYKRLSQKRIDAVGWIGTKPMIFEVRPFASFRLFGQIKGYEWYWMKRHPEKEPPSLALVCEFMPNEDRQIFHAHDIHVFIV